MQRLYEIIEAGIYGFVVFLVVVAFAAVARAEEPCPELLTSSKQVLVCYFPTYTADGTRVRGVGEEWVVTWGMCKTWEPVAVDKWILFVDKYGRRTTIPVPEEYVCTVL